MRSDIPVRDAMKHHSPNSHQPSQAILSALGFCLEPDQNGWFNRNETQTFRYDDQFCNVAIRPEGALARLRIEAEMAQANINDMVHGGFLLGLIDYALFVGPTFLGIERVLGGSTIEISSQFYSPVLPCKPADLVVEVMKETNRLLFCRGTISQENELACGFSGTLRRRNADDSMQVLERFTAARV